MSVKLSAALPRHFHVNGLDDLLEKMAGDPGQHYTAVLVFDTSKVTIDTDSNEATPTARILRIEPILRADDRKEVGRILQHAYEARTGETVLPLDLEVDIRQIGGEDQ